MSRRHALPSNIDIFLNLVCRLTKIPPGVLTENDVRKVLYIYKIFDLLWFQRFSPTGAQKKVSVVLNAKWESKAIPYGVEQITDLDERALRYITDKMRRPEWVRSTGQRFMLCIADVFDPDMKMA